MESIKQQIAYLGRMMFERRLTDTSGGNISARVGDRIYITARYCGSKKHWQITEDDVISGLLENDEVLSHERCSREAKAHLATYHAFPDVMGIVHAHAFHVLPFCMAGRPIEPVLDCTEKFGTIDVVKYAPAHSADLAGYVVEALAGKEETIRKQAAAVLMPRHGLFAAGKDVWAAFDATERIDWNAYCILSSSLIPEKTLKYDINRHA